MRGTPAAGSCTNRQETATSFLSWLARPSFSEDARYGPVTGSSPAALSSPISCVSELSFRRLVFSGSRHGPWHCLERAMRALRRLVRDIATSPNVPVGVPGAFVALLDAASAVHSRMATARRWAYDSGWVSQTDVDALSLIHI